jgi:predicted phosphodiesterase
VNKNHTVLSFSCAHVPFEKNRYLDFILETYVENNCDEIVCLGDFFDNHAISYHDHDPDGLSAGVEFKKAKSTAKEWHHAFPDMKITHGNHDRLPYRKMLSHGLPNAMVKSPNEIWGLPKGWTWHDKVVIDGVVYVHGDGKSGKYMYSQWADDNMQSTVTGHGHSCAGVAWHATPTKLIFGMGVGCGIDINSYAAAYGKTMGRRPIIGCGIVKNGIDAQFIPMKLE